MNCITFIFFSLCIALLSILFSLSTTKYEDIVYNSLKNNSVSNVYFTNNPLNYDNMDKYYESFLEIGQYLDNQNWKLARFNKDCRSILSLDENKVIEFEEDINTIFTK